MIIRPKYTAAEVQAVCALHKGVANDGQQKLALDWIMREGARITDLAYIDSPTGDRDTYFALGRQYVGHVLREMLIPATLDIAKAADEKLRAETRRATR